MGRAHSKRRYLSSVCTNILTVIVIGLFMFPIGWMIMTSLQYTPETGELTNSRTFTLGSYLTVLSRTDFLGYYANSIMVALSVIGLSFLIGISGAYALGRLRFKGRDDISLWILSTVFGPPIMALLPFFLLFRTLGMLDSLPAVVVVHTASFLPFVVWMLRGFFEEIPREIEEAALVDGCSRMNAFRRVVLPLIGPGAAATAILTFIFSWNEFLLAFVLTGARSKTAPVAIYSFMGGATGRIDWGPLTAAGILVTLPVMIFALLVQQNLVRGLTAGAVKG